MGEITHDGVEQYMMGLLPERDEVLCEMEAQADRQRIPIVGPAVGRFLFQLARMTGAKTVFEMGSAIGYSTLWWARAVGAGGRVVYTDSDRRNANDARRYFERAGVADRVDMRVGDALELLSEEKGTYDIIFNDVDKQDYPRVLRLAPARVRPGGLLVSDNVLWHGRVAAPADGADPHTRGILEYNRLLYASTQFYTTIVPLRDGVSVALKVNAAEEPR
jgi:caffeoyl-CoA O-methyltransferase